MTPTQKQTILFKNDIFGFMVIQNAFPVEI